MEVDQNPPDSLIFHSGPIDEGWGVIDFWESREAFDRFAQSRLQPAIQELVSQLSLSGHTLTWSHAGSPRSAQLN